MRKLNIHEELAIISRDTPLMITYHRTEKPTLPATVWACVVREAGQPCYQQSTLAAAPPPGLVTSGVPTSDFNNPSHFIYFNNSLQ